MFLLAAVFLLSQSAPATPLDQAILGGWHYNGFLYEGRRYPNPNPNLVVRFTFFDCGKARLYYYRTNEHGFCERISDYSVQGSSLKQTVSWVNPRNDSMCARDPDMQNAGSVENRIEIVGTELHIYMRLKDQDFVYILARDEH